MSGSESAQVHRVACESCRTKKCKCDRVIPTCAQCEKAGTSCSYPESFKRGFPEGYLAGLEQRLMETEIALFETLTQLSCPLPSQESRSRLKRALLVYSKLDASRSKSARTEEWSRLPLQSREQRREWWEEKLKELDLQDCMISVPGLTTIDQPGDVVGSASPGDQQCTGPSSLSATSYWHSESLAAHSNWDRPNRSHADDHPTGIGTMTNDPSKRPVGSVAGWSPGIAPTGDVLSHARSATHALLEQRDVGRAQTLSTKQSNRFF